ncbi:hypothetical protein QAD02_001825 [Eretmocerus hayati]|uniref:Uncharacterized protein n=1 Tax=Eretmocerus hayati TaxID=131215 RepID=A0ACC2NHI9_9HYME|nr:hypothetical protein QAD02_001825 [Eretmocerus hayati]
MSCLHLSHALPWSQLAESDFVTYKCSGVSLPVGSCGLIHVENKRTKCQVKNREFLDDRVCPSDTCETVGKQIFRKNDDKFYELRGFPNITCAHFINCFKTAVTEFANSFSKKNLADDNKSNRKKITLQDEDVKQLGEEAEEILERDKGWKALDDYGLWWNYCHCHCHCQLITLLMEAKKLSTILSFDEQVLKDFFKCQHGGQAVGNNLSFLLYHVFGVYIHTNLILCCNFENEPEKWGFMAPGTYDRKMLSTDCDGQTFLQASRQYLADDVYMKDFDATKQMIKDCFEFIYFSKILYDKVRPELDFYSYYLGIRPAELNQQK